MQDHAGNMTETLRKELKVTRIWCIISSVITFCLLAAMIVLLWKLQPAYEFMKETGPVIRQTLEETDLGKLSESLSGLDVETLNETLQSLDTEELSQVLENVNNMSALVTELNEKYDSMVSAFGMGGR